MKKLIAIVTILAVIGAVLVLTHKSSQPTPIKASDINAPQF